MLLVLILVSHKCLLQMFLNQCDKLQKLVTFYKIKTIVKKYFNIKFIMNVSTGSCNFI